MLQQTQYSASTWSHRHRLEFFGFACCCLRRATKPELSPPWKKIIPCNSLPFNTAQPRPWAASISALPSHDPAHACVSRPANQHNPALMPKTRFLYIRRLPVSPASSTLAGRRPLPGPICPYALCPWQKLPGPRGTYHCQSGRCPVSNRTRTVPPSSTKHRP